MRYLAFAADPLYLKALKLEYDATYLPETSLVFGDVLLCDPFAAQELRYLPKYVTIEIVPDGTEVERVTPLVHALKLRGLPTSYAKKPPSEKSKNYAAYLAAAIWAEQYNQRYATVQVGNSHAPHEVITDPREAVSVINALHGKLYSIDYETLPDHTIYAVALADERMAWLLMGDALRTLPEVRGLLTDPTSEGIAHSAIYEYKVTAQNSLGTLDPMDMTPLHDTRLMNWVLDNKPGTNRLKPLVRNLLGRDALDFDQVVPDGDITKVDPALLGIYAAAGDARNTYDLFQVLNKRLQNENLWHIYNDIERPLTPVLAEMELSRLPVDLKIVGELYDQYTTKLTALTQAIRYLGYDGSLTSGDQFAEWIYGTLGLPMLRKTKLNNRGATDKHTLNTMQGLHPAMPVYKEIKETESLITKFLKPILRINKPWLEYSLSQTSTKTGRLSCKALTDEPNSAKKRKGEGFNVNQFTYEVRKAIRDPDPDMVMWSADYSQEEPRVVAVASGDPVMLDDYRQGKDAYSTLGRAMGFPVDSRGIVSDKVSRKIVKGVFLGWLYGAGGPKMQETVAMQGIHLSIAECTSYAAMLKGTWARCVAWRQEVIERARIDKASFSLEGRRELLPEIVYRDPGTREAAEREAVNMVPQGTSADILKLGMPKVHRLIKASGLGRDRLPMHDEIMGTAQGKYVKELTHAVAEIMQQYERVPLVVEPKWGASWYACQ